MFSLLPNDIYEIIIKYLYPRDILSLSMANKQFNSLMSNRKLNQRLSVHFGYPINTNYRKFDYYESLSVEYRLEKASKTGDKRIVDYLLERKKSFLFSPERAIELALKRGHRSIFLSLLSTMKFNFNRIFISACKSENFEVIKIISASNRVKMSSYDEGSFILARKGNDKIVKFIIKRLPDTLLQAIKGSIRGKKYLLLKSLLKGVDDVKLLQLSLEYASFLGRIKVIDLLTSTNNLDLNSALNRAVYNGQYSSFVKLVNLGANNFKYSFLLSALNGWVDIFRYLTHYNLVSIDKEIIETFRFIEDEDILSIYYNYRYGI